MGKKLKFTIASKLALAFGILMVTVGINSFLTYENVQHNHTINRELTDVYAPSAAYMNDLFFIVNTSKLLIKNWIYIDQYSNTKDKRKLKKLQNKEFPILNITLTTLVSDWKPAEQKAYKNLLLAIDTLFKSQQTIMRKLNSYENYQDSALLVNIKMEVEDDSEMMILTYRILESIDNLSYKLSSMVDQADAKMEKSFIWLENLILIWGLIQLFMVIITAFLTTKSLVTPIKRLNNLILTMSKGNLPNDKVEERSDEIGQMGESLNLLVNGLRETSEFSLKIGQGDYDSRFEPLSNKDVLGNSLILMRENLKKAAEEDSRRKKEDMQRSWATHGIAKFGEILRQSTDDFGNFAYSIISELVNYLEASQGGLFIINDDDKEKTFIELVAAYAFERQKHYEKKIEIGVGVVGQCVLENETVYLTDIPNNYIKITSGLGEDNPSSLLIVPLKLNDEVYGVVEIASFKKIEPYQIEFVEKVGETIASTISSVKINMNTARLLEESEEQSEKLAQQEKEMRDHMQELQKTQEEMVFKQKEEKSKQRLIKKEYRAQLKEMQEKQKVLMIQAKTQKTKFDNYQLAMNNMIGIAEFTKDGEFMTANKKYQKICNLKLEELIGKRLSYYISKKDMNTKVYHAFWAEIGAGKVQTGEHNYLFKTNDKWLLEVYTPIKNKKGVIDSVIALCIDITEQKRKEVDWDKQIAELRKEIAELNGEIDRLNE